jgi:hypothetical protein
MVGKDERGLVYTYSQTRVELTKVNVYLKELVVSVGRDGTVTNVHYNSSGAK